MACLVCDNTGWVCENHPDRPWRGNSQRADACECGAGMPCELCNPCGGIDESPTLSPIARVTYDKNGPRH
jgi:hypothetical protein